MDPPDIPDAMVLDARGVPEKQTVETQSFHYEFCPGIIQRH